MTTTTDSQEIECVRLTIIAESDRLLASIVQRICVSQIPLERKIFLLSHAQRLLKHYLTYAGNRVPEELDPFKWLESNKI